MPDAGSDSKIMRHTLNTQMLDRIAVTISRALQSIPIADCFDPANRPYIRRDDAAGILVDGDCHTICQCAADAFYSYAFSFGTTERFSINC